MYIEPFSPEETPVLNRHFTNAEQAVFGLTNLPDVVKGALFARYSRTGKSLRRLFLDEFYVQDEADAAAVSTGLARAEDLYSRVFNEYGDDSVAQLVGVHLAVEAASNILTKVLERGRLMSYLEQSTRYVPYNDKPGGRWRYHTPAELAGTALESRFDAAAERAFQLYSDLIEPLQAHLREQNPKPEGVSNAAYRSSIRGKACDILRGLLPAATASNLGIYGSAQGYEALVLRLLASPLAEARATGEAMLAELKKLIPTFMERVERPDRGGVWRNYFQDIGAEMTRVAGSFPSTAGTRDGPQVNLTEFDSEGETQVVAAALYEYSNLSDEEALEKARAMSAGQRSQIIEAYAGNRTNRRHKPGRAFERTDYRFDVVADYGAFRDLQRHRLLTIEWQRLDTNLGYDLPPEIEEIGEAGRWREIMDSSAALADQIASAGMPAVAQYAVPMAYRIRFNMQLNAREAVHLIELRTSEQAHRNYRSIARRMFELIRDEAGMRPSLGR